MNLRQALIEQCPTLGLQRAAQAEIARLDALIRDQGAEIVRLTQENGELRHEVEVRRDQVQRFVTGDSALATA